MQTRRVLLFTIFVVAISTLMMGHIKAFNPGVINANSIQNNKYNIEVPKLYPNEEEYNICIETCKKEEECNDCSRYKPRTEEEINIWNSKYIKLFTLMKDKSAYYAQSAEVVSIFVGKAIMDSTEIENTKIIANVALEQLKSATKINGFEARYNQTRDDILLYNYNALIPSLRSVAKQVVQEVWFVFNNFNSMTREENQKYRDSITTGSKQLATVNTKAHNKLAKLKLVNAYCIDMNKQWGLLAIKPMVKYPEALVWKKQQIGSMKVNEEYDKMIKDMNRSSSQ